LLPEVAAAPTQVSTPTAAVVMGAGQVIVTQRLPEAAVCGVHDATGTLVVAFVVHEVAVH
jgi:hypothetical protein